MIGLLVVVAVTSVVALDSGDQLRARRDTCDHPRDDGLRLMALDCEVHGNQAEDYRGYGEDDGDDCHADGFRTRQPDDAGVPGPCRLFCHGEDSVTGAGDLSLVLAELLRVGKRTGTVVVGLKTLADYLYRERVLYWAFMDR